MLAAAESSRVSTAAALRVGEWRVEPSLNEISSRGRTVKLEPKAMAVLVLLAGRAGQAVSRDDLLAAAWPGVVVSDDALTQVILKLRKALDEPGGPGHIQTISKRGYRLVAAVADAVADAPGQAAGGPRPIAAAAELSVGELIAATAEPSAAGPLAGMAEPMAGSPRRPRVAWVAAAAVVLSLLVGAMAAWLGLREADDAPVGAALAAPGVAGDARPTVGIGRFEALSGDAQELLLARGIAADLATDLSKTPGIWVVSLDGQPPRPAGAADYLVSGSVQREADRLRVHVHLREASTGKQLWSERFDRETRGLFAIQDELAPKILRALPAKLSEAELRRTASRYTRNLEAYEYFQRGQLALLTRQRADNETAREMYGRAVALDAAFARAYAGLALTHAADYRNRWTDDPAAALDRAVDMAQAAFELNPDIPETSWVLAFVHIERRQHEQAIRLLEAAIRLNPSFADGYALMGGVYTYVGRPAETVRLVRTALRLDPQAGHLHFLLLGRAFLFLGDLEQARLNLEQALSRNVGNLEAHAYLAALHVAAADTTAAQWEADEIRALQPDFNSRAWLDAYPMTDPAQRARLVAALAPLGF